MKTIDINAFFSTLIALGSLVVSIFALIASHRSGNQAKKVGIVDLHTAWEGVRIFDPKNPITPQAVAALQALRLTSEMWLNDVVEKKIIYEFAWNDYKTLYDSFNAYEAKLPGLEATGKSSLSQEMKKAYDAMSKYQP